MGIPEKGNPQETGLGGEVSRGSDETRNFTSRIKRYGKAHSRSLEMVAYLEDLEQSRLSETKKLEVEKLRIAIADCGHWLEFSNYYTVDKIRLTGAKFCKKTHLCPLCAIRRGLKVLKSYVDRYDYIKIKHPDMRASMITLTVKNGPYLQERFDHLQRGVKRLLKRRRDYLTKGRGKTQFRHVEGLVGTYEVTNKGNGWHPHTHLIVLHREDIDQDALSAEWQEITGDSFIVDIRPIQNPDNAADDFVEVFKYAIKFSDLSLSDNWQAYEILKGKRLIYSAGKFRGVSLPDEWLDEELDGLPYFKMMYRYFGDAGYVQVQSKYQQANM